MNRDDKTVGIFLVIAVIAILGVAVLVSMAQCTHGHHVGVCGREYQAYKAGRKICTCTADHY